MTHALRGPRGRPDPHDRAKRPADEHEDDGQGDPRELVPTEGTHELGTPTVDLEGRHGIDHERARPEPRRRLAAVVAPQEERPAPGTLRRGLPVLQQARAAQEPGGLELAPPRREAGRLPEG